MKKYIGYTTGVFDLFHIGHLNILKKAREQCDYLRVGVTTDEEVKNVKGYLPVIPFEERIEIVKAIKFVDEAVPEISVNKISAWHQNKFDIIFKGDDWKGTKKWNELEEEFQKLGVQVVYFPYTKTTSSSDLREALKSIKTNNI